MLRKEAGHTGVSNGLHFIDIIIVDDFIKSCVEFIQEVDNLVWSAGAGQVCESHYITEQHTHTVLKHRRNNFSHLRIIYFLLMSLNVNVDFCSNQDIFT